MLFRGRTLLLLLPIALFLGCSRYQGGYYHGGMNNSKAMHRATMRPYYVGGKKYYPSSVRIGTKYRGIASWYGDDFHGNLTSNGERYNMFSYTAAHKTLPMNTMVKVTNLRNHKSVVVRINDRGPFVPNRIIDLSYAAAKTLGMISTGTAPVEITVLGFNGKIYSSKPVHKTTLINSPKKIATKTTEYIAKPQFGEFGVQIGAFKDLKKANAYKKRYNNYLNRYYAIIERSHDNVFEVYRVILKGFKNEKEARDFINSSKIPNAFIVKN